MRRIRKWADPCGDWLTITKLLLSEYPGAPAPWAKAGNLRSNRGFLRLSGYAESAFILFDAFAETVVCFLPSLDLLFLRLLSWLLTIRTDGFFSNEQPANGYRWLGTTGHPLV